VEFNGEAACLLSGTNGPRSPVVGKAHVLARGCTRGRAAAAGWVAGALVLDNKRRHRLAALVRIGRRERRRLFAVAKGKAGVDADCFSAPLTRGRTGISVYPDLHPRHPRHPHGLRAVMHYILDGQEVRPAKHKSEVGWKIILSTLDR